MSFQGVSLAAGLATRLRPLTSAQPKALLPILGIPSLYFSFWQFQALGLDAWAVNSHHQPDMIAGLVDRWPTVGKIHISHEQELQGSAGCYPLLAGWRGSSDLIVYNPDIISDFDLRLAVERFERDKPAALIVTTATPPPGGVASVHIDRHGRVVGFGAQPPTTANESVYGAGIFILAARFLAGIPAGPSSLTEHLSNVMDDGELVMTMAHPGFWVDMGDSHERYFLAQQLALEHFITTPHSRFTSALQNLWALLHFDAEVIASPNTGKNHSHSIVEKSIPIPQSAKIGPSCFIFGEHQLADDFYGARCLLFGKSLAPLSGSFVNEIVAGTHRLKLPRQTV